MAGIARGAPFHAEYINAAGGVAAPFLFYQDGSDVEIYSGATLPATVQCIITDICAYVSTAGGLSIFDGAAVDDANIEAGELITRFTGNNTGILTMIQRFVTPYYCKAGTKPKVTCGAVACAIVLRGTLYRIGS